MKSRKITALLAATGLVLGASTSAFGDLSDRRDIAQDQTWTLDGPASANLSTLPDDAHMADEKPPFRVELKQPLKANERVVIWHPLNKSLTDGTTLKIRFRGQSDHATSIKFGVSSTLKGETIFKNLDPIELGPEARDSFRSFEMPEAKSGSYFFWFDLGKAPVKIEFSHIHLYVERVKISDEQARINAKMAPSAIAHRIDLYRRGPMTVSVVDKTGKPIANASVKVEQVRHEFLFGASARKFNLNAKDSVSRASEKSFLELFNAVAVPFYWKEFQPVQNGPTGVLQDSILQWAKKNQLACFAQGLVTADDYPSWQPQLPMQMTPAIRSHIVSVVKNYSNKVPIWSIYDDASSSITGDAKSPFQAWLTSVGGLSGAIQRTIEWSRAAAPAEHIQLEVSQASEPLSDNRRSGRVPAPRAEHDDRNLGRWHDEHGEHHWGEWHDRHRLSWKHRLDRDGNHHGEAERDAADDEWQAIRDANAKFKRVVETLQSVGARIDLLGLRINMRQMPIEQTDIWKNCSLLSQLEIPLQIDELAVMSGEWQNGYPPEASWPSTKEGEEDQAKRIVDAYQVLFSNRAVRAIYYLNICDRESLYHAPYGLLRSDGTQKPAYKALLNLLHHTWWTQALGKTDDKGAFSTRAYWGDYNISVEAKGKTVKVPFKFSSSATQAAQSVKITLPE